MLEHTLDDIVPFFVEPALAFQTKKTSFFSGHSIGQLARGVPVTERYITFVPQWVIGESMFFEIIENIAIRPIDDRVQLETIATFS